MIAKTNKGKSMLLSSVQCRIVKNGDLLNRKRLVGY